MKQFHISDVLSVTTGRLVSSRHMEGVYDILNFLTGDNLFTHQLPRASRECEPWLRTQFPKLFPDSPEMAVSLNVLDGVIADIKRDWASKGEKKIRTVIDGAVSSWVEGVRRKFGLPEMLPVYEMGADMHTRIDPIEEAQAMVGQNRVIAASLD